MIDPTFRKQVTFCQVFDCQAEKKTTTRNHQPGDKRTAILAEFGNSFYRIYITEIAELSRKYLKSPRQIENCMGV